VRLDDAPPVLGGEVGDLVSGSAHAGVVHQERGGAETPDGLVEELLDLVLARHVDAQDDGPSSRTQDEALGLAGAVLVGVVRDGDVGALLRELAGDLAPYARVRTRYDGDLVLETQHPSTLPRRGPGASRVN